MRRVHRLLFALAGLNLLAAAVFGIYGSLRVAVVKKSTFGQIYYGSQPESPTIDYAAFAKRSQDDYGMTVAPDIRGFVSYVSEPGIKALENLITLGVSAFVINAVILSIAGMLTDPPARAEPESR